MTPSILPKSESNFQRVMERVGSETLTDLDVSKLTLNPLTCEAFMLPHLALSLDVSIEGLEEDEARIYLQNAREIKKYGGSVYAVKKAIDSMFDEGKLIQWYEGNLNPHLFDVDVKLKAQPSKVYDVAKFEKAKALIHEAKNVRSHLNAFRIRFPETVMEVHKQEQAIFSYEMDSSLNFNNMKGDIKKQEGNVFVLELENTKLLAVNSEMKSTIKGGAVWQI